MSGIFLKIRVKWVFTIAVGVIIARSLAATEPAFSRLKSAMQTPEQFLKYVQS